MSPPPGPSAPTPVLAAIIDTSNEISRCIDNIAGLQPRHQPPYAVLLTTISDLYKLWDEYQTIIQFIAQADAKANATQILDLARYIIIPETPRPTGPSAPSPSIITPEPTP